MRRAIRLALLVTVGAPACSSLPFYGEGQKEAAGTVIGRASRAASTPRR